MQIFGRLEETVPKREYRKITTVCVPELKMLGEADLMGLPRSEFG